jgi:hypothetical protein
MSSEISPDAQRFTRLLRNYFGAWRGQAAEATIGRWITKQDIKTRTLDELYLEFIETRKIEPVNTIGVADIRETLRRIQAAQPPTKQLPDPEAQHNPEVAEGLRDLVSGLANKANVGKEEA